MTTRATCTSSASALPASCSDASARNRRRVHRRLRCAMPRPSTPCAKRSTHACARSCPAARALITGKRDALSAPVNDAMYVSGLGHVLSISGYHMAVVAGMVFFAMRALFALFGAFADRHPIKKWAAFAALVVSAFYLALSGAEVATQRSFIMIAIVLIGVMVDRPVLTLRTVTIAALVVLFLAPEAVVHQSFQMSFAATLALIAAYAYGQPLTRAGAD